MSMPNYLWGEAIRHATYLINRVATRALSDKTPYEMLRSKRPNISHLRVVGCVGYAKIEGVHLRNLDDRSRMLVHLGMEPGSKAYRLYDPNTRRIIVSRGVVFDEEKIWNWSKEGAEKENGGSFVVAGSVFADYDEASLAPKAITSVEEAEEASETINSVSKQSTSEAVCNEDQSQCLRSSERQTRPPAYLEDYILLAEELGEEVLLYLNNEPRNFEEAKGSKEWRRACEDEIESIEKNRTWDLVDLPFGEKPIGLKWVFKLKLNADGSINKFKARLVAKGYVQQYGVDFEEVFAPVARLGR